MTVDFQVRLREAITMPIDVIEKEVLEVIFDAIRNKDFNTTVEGDNLHVVREEGTCINIIIAVDRRRQRLLSLLVLLYCDSPCISL